MIPTQMLKGVLDGCILAVIDESELYGYEISEKLNSFGFDKIAEGTIYPLLIRLERNNLLKATVRKSKVGPNRKYYRLTEEGEKALALFKYQFMELNHAVWNVLNQRSEENE